VTQVDTSSIFVTSLNAKKDRMTFMSTVSLKGKHPKWLAGYAISNCNDNIYLDIANN